ncbi:MAG: hypothetical protein KO254_00295 [Methanoculleus marisnigri]|nr:hypothetical protein [Methanoculleus marisnigri]
MKINPKIRENSVVMTIDVLYTTLLSRAGKYRMIEKSKPTFARRTIRLIEEIRAVAIPTSCGVYIFAAAIQKMNPKNALDRYVSKI